MTAATAVGTSGRPAAVAIGEVLDGKYQITGEVGRGAMGIVYEAIHLALERRVAVKTMLDDVSGDAQIGARFEREARAASAIGHPNIVDVFDLGRTRDGLLYMVMEMLDGESLGSMLKRTPKLSFPLAIHLMSQVLGGLSAAHKHGIVHRDLKPDNIFVLNGEERPGFVKILDFGISKVIAPPTAGSPNVTTKVAGTMVGSVLGTPLYMSPEQAIGQVTAIDHRTDIYSAGVVLYEMLCGRTPYLGESYVQIFAALLEGNYPPPRSLTPEIPAELEGAIIRALDRDMDKRFPSAAAMRQALGGGTGEVTPAPMLMPLSIGEPLHLPEAPPTSGKSSIVLAENPRPAPSAFRSRRATQGTDPFAPPPDADAAPLVADDLDRPIALRAPTRTPELTSPEVTKPRLAPTRTMAPAKVLSAKTRSRLLLVLAVLAIAVAARIAYSMLRPTGSLSIRRAAIQAVELLVIPAEATVQIDHRPTGQRKLDLEAGSQHLINVAAPGRLTRRFSFTATPGLTLTIHLGHTLPLPSPTDPVPLPAELSAEAPEQARPRSEVESALASLDRYAECLSQTGDTSMDAKKGGGRPRMRADELKSCRRLFDEAVAVSAAMPALQAAAEAYLAAIQGAARMDQLAKLGNTFRAEFLAARTAWQMEELALEQARGKTDQPSSWHMRRVALAAQAWLRALRAGQGAEHAAARLQEFQRALLDHLGQAGAIQAADGQTEFLQAATALVALAASPSGKRPAEVVALDECRRLLSSFNALVLQ